MLIIASFLFSFSGCGYKAPPYYEKSAPAEDDNVKFILEEQKFPIKENNESCE